MDEKTLNESEKLRYVQDQITARQHWHYKITEFVPFLFKFLFLPVRSLQTRNPKRRSQLRITKANMCIINIKTPACPLMKYFIDAMYVRKKDLKKNYNKFTQTWCCIRTHSLFISVKFCSTNSTASMTVSPSL